ncbi:odorant receptor 13a-like isoform X1 [Neodiprion fabricii]|uniref:odorant receptor 13a-like isoform X1 n=2 Tax=Neodiprion fabricii TaxID=2872261 RepID=UPI001ED95DB4|nr:odorant receptor 13a-like isoform X1 [Neodiprion fabricii]
MQQRSDHHPLLKGYVTVLRSLGLWTIPAKSWPVLSYPYLLYKIFVLLMISFLITTLSADAYTYNDDLLVVTDDGCIIAGLSVILIKLLSFQLNPDKVERMIDFVDKNIRALHEEGNPEHLKIWKYYVLRERVTIYSFGTIGMFLVFALMFLTTTEPGELPIRSRYPFDVGKSPVHELMFLYQGCVLTVSMLSILSMDNIVLTFCSQIFCRLEILKKNFVKSLEDENQKAANNDGKTPPVDFRENLLKCIKRHQEIIEFVQSLDNFFSPLMLAQLMASNVLICLTGFQAILVVGQASGFFKFTIYLSGAFCQLFFWCWFGNEMIHQSTSVAEALWLSPWELQKLTSISSLITIPLMRAKKPLKLTAGKFYVMSMEVFISVGSQWLLFLLHAAEQDERIRKLDRRKLGSWRVTWNSQYILITITLASSTLPVVVGSPLDFVKLKEPL